MKRVAVLVAMACAGCAPPAVPPPLPDGTIFEGTRGPIQYRAPPIRDLDVPSAPKEAFGESCQTSFYLPTAPSSPFPGSGALANLVTAPTVGVAWGDGGIIRALARARESAGGRTLYDVRLDVHSTSVLGIWHRDCVEVHAAVLDR